MKRLFLAGVVCAMAGATGALRPAPSAQAGEALDLTALFNPTSGVVRDTNGDGIPDTIAARVVVPANPAHEDVEGAATIAGRLGYETSAMTLPVVVRDTEVSQPAGIALPILVGRGNQFVKKLIADGVVDLKALTPGQGLVAVVHSPLGGADGVVAVGADDEGTLAAANELGARLPRVWGMNGISLDAVGDQALKYLRARGVNASQATVPSILVDAERRGLASLTLRVGVPAGEGDRAVHALQALDEAHRRGQESKVLDLQNAAVTTIDIVSGGKVQGHATVSRSGLNPRTLTPPIDPDELAPDSPGDRGAAPAAEAAGPARHFDLSNAYSIEGWFGDSYADLIPDRTDTTLLLGDASESVAAGEIAARLGLESTGIALPIAHPADKVRTPEREPSPILVGRTNPLVERLVKIGKARLADLQAGDGAVEIVPRAFGNATATVVAGGDASGTEAAANYLARRVPYVWDNSAGALRYEEVAGDVNRFMQMRSAAGQASQAIAEIDNVIDGLKGKAIESFEAKLYLEAGDARLDAHLAAAISSSLAGADVKVTSQAMTDPVTVFDDTFAVPWEVEEFRTRVRSEVLPKVKGGSKVELEARLSEPPEVRRNLVDEVRAELTRAGATDPRVAVLSAYKQGFLWLTEQVIPELKGKGARAIHVKVAEYHPDLSKKYKFYQVPSRWLQELYPSDEIAQRELGISKDSFSLELVDHPKEIYTVQATNAAGKVILEASFSPKFAEREYLEKFPGWARVDVTTGWLRAMVDGQTAADSRIKTDPERFWDHYQSDILPKIYDNVMKVTENRPMPDKQPFHRDLDVEVWMSEPDFRLGVDEEQVSSLESLHEDLYFVTLDFFDALGRTTTRRRLAAPGKIFPIVHPSRSGQPGEVRVHYAGNASPTSKVEISYRQKGAPRPVRVARPLPKIDATAAAAVRVVVRSDRVHEVELRVEAKDDREATRAADALDNLERMHRAGVFRTALSYDRVDRVVVDVGLKEVHARRVVASTGESAASNVRRATGSAQKGPIVAWDHVISPDESEQIVARLAAFPEVKAYRAGHSYRGRDISVMEITQPTTSEIVSHAKLTTLKPTIFITGRQHANEVSSTSHILRLAELLATDPAYKPILKKVNVILHPVENPDGAQMAFDLQKLTPTHMLHAGRYSALGMDVASQVGVADPLLPEALVRNKVWRDWLPDIYLNPHGYPSHEWVQQFAGYVPPGFRTYVSTRGWYTSINTLRDPRYPGYSQAVESLREYVVRSINRNADVRAMDLRAQSRYRKWAYGFEPYVFNQEIYRDTAIYYSDPETGEPSGSRRFGAARFGGGGDGPGGGGGRFNMNSWPQVTFFVGGTEAPDETAQSEWLNLVARAGFSYLMASIDYLRDGKPTVVRIDEDAQRDGVTRMTFRGRPLLTPRPAGAERSERLTTASTGGK